MLRECQTVKPKLITTGTRDISRDNIDSIIERIRSREAILRVVAYPWGVEFDICEPGVQGT